MLSIFNNPMARGAVGRKDREVLETSGNRGLLGDDDQVRARLTEASKADELVSKVIISV